MNIFLETYNLPRLSQKVIETLKILIMNKEIESAIKSLPTEKSPVPNGFTGEFYQTFKGKLMPIHLKLFEKN